MGDILMTSAIFKEADGTKSVLHFGVPMSAPEIQIQDNWKTLGMRGTGSNDIIIKDLFVADAAVAFSRKAGEWHPVFHMLSTIAFTLVYSVYVGIAQKARNIAVEIAKKRPINHYSLDIAGRMETSLRAAQMAHSSMLDAVNKNTPSEIIVNDVMIGRTLVGQNAIKTVELAMELAGGVGFYRDTGLEILFRDIQAAKYHPLQAGSQAHYAGAMALGQSVKNIY